MFIDFVKIYCKAGDGAKGVDSFFRDKYSRYPIRNGGDGGKGGDVIFEADSNKYSLLDFKYNKEFKAQKGSLGSSNKKKGANGKELLVKVPVGTIIRDVHTGFLIRDLDKAHERVIVCKGGEGGKGNAAVRVATPGKPGEEKTLSLELKLIADVGLLGFPNAGKSTLISKVSNAKPKIAAYPFTTLEPMLGVVKGENREILFTVADIPGLIEGAHQGKGLGHQFLRHIERTKVLIHLLDVSEPDSYDKYLILNKELECYKKELAGKPQLVVANKIDLPEAHEHEVSLRARIRGEMLTISAKTGEGIPALVARIVELLKTL